ncbi:hypothetical protein [Loktanella sp. Alg231-35]|uniref:hypothetical protein n=1 Tax=Loktanella sp. Alg231-35 TaxID=1922220 RepID=UPI000D559FAF|nr:hypothetical protein [Loktanella sp. Alg231-35]
MNKTEKILTVCAALFLASCDSINNAGQNLADNVARSIASNYVGQSYAVLSSRTRMTSEFPPRTVPTIGELVAKEPVADGNTVYYHAQLNEKRDSGFASLTTGDQVKRYDVYAYLVGFDGAIADWAHARANTRTDCVGAVVEFGVVSVEGVGERCGDEELDTALSPRGLEFTTSNGRSIDVWR